MTIATQLAIFLENRPGTLARMCAALSDAGVNVFAVSTSDTVDHTVIRMVVSDPQRALFLLGEHGTMVVENEVLLIEGDNRPGTLARVAEKLGKAEINIEYLYAASSPSAKRGLLVLRVSDPKKAQRVLRRL